ncbi:MAG: hypothetical protein IPO90_00345 [Flavobacteriales bacterium]|nr:hypothetical protein [Flavobacteriales bacterium]MBL0045827.1 hypothetical protein [Flavobacteriales bacterium]
MNKIREKTEVEKEPAKASSKSSKSARLPRALISVMNGSFLTKEAVLGNMRFILFCAGLMLCYIAYGYWTERTVRDLEKTNSELKEMRSEYLTVRSHLEQAQQQSHVASDISTLGLKESKTPPIRIAVEKDQLEKPQPE